MDVLKLAAQVEDFPPVTGRIALANGTLYLDGTFQEGKPEIVRNRLPVRYDPKAPQPTHWLRFLSDLLYPEDIPTVQEFIGYCLIPSNKGQRMMVIKGNGGEGKSQIGVVLSRLFGCNMKDGSIGKTREHALPVPIWSTPCSVWTMICGWKPAPDQLCQVHRDRTGTDGLGAQGQAELSGLDVRPPAGVQQRRFAGIV